ncbi:MAG: aspartate aminotransferase family protein [Acidobacteriaceae bacterium]|nr:aspartate aminotransferase family protein [Acidobacteriaceae bacterium]
MSTGTLSIVRELDAIGTTADELYREHVNPQWARLLDLLEVNVRYSRCEGARLHAADGRTFVDFLSGYCVHNLGHNHPYVVSALEAELRRDGPAMVQSHVPELAGELAARLCTLAGGQISKVFFCSSGSEGVEAAIKFARARTRRSGLLYADGAFHGLTTGALSLMGDPFWRKGFGPLLPDCESVPFGDIDALEQKLASKRFAAFVLEPIQGEAGIRVPAHDYLSDAQHLCRDFGTLFVLDEVQTGLGRTGEFLAGHHYGVQPDIIVLAKALSGGLIPVGAVLMSDAVYESVYDSLKRSIVHTSTYSENALAMRAGLAVLDVLESERLSERAERIGEYLRERLRDALAGYEMVKEVRGAGLFCGIEFTAPKQLKLRAAFEAFRAVHAGLFGQMVVMNLFKRGMLTQMCGNNFMVLKVAPPLIIGEEEADEFVNAVTDVIELVHGSTSFWSDALGMARRAINI